MIGSPLSPATLDAPAYFAEQFDRMDEIYDPFSGYRAYRLEYRFAALLRDVGGLFRKFEPVRASRDTLTALEDLPRRELDLGDVPWTGWTLAGCHRDRRAYRMGGRDPSGCSTQRTLARPEESTLARYVTSVPTALSPADAFAFMADVTHFADWDPGVKRVVLVAGDGASVGSAYELTVQAAGSTVMRYEVTDYEPPRRLLLVAHTPFLTSEDEVRVDASGSGCTVTYDAKLTLNGPLRLFDPLLRIAFRRIGDRAAAGLRRALSRPAVA